MASRPHEIPFLIGSEFESYRLLELPPDLLNRLKSDSRPKLQLKSAFKASESAEDQGKVVLCTDETTYGVRQVQSSNSVFVINAFGENESGDPSSVLAVAQCPTLLELVVSSSQTIALLNNELPIFSIEAYQARCNADDNRHDVLETPRIWEDIPVSDLELQRARSAICAFILDGNDCQPDSETILSTWKVFLDTVVLKGVDLSVAVPLNMFETTMLEDGFPPQLLEAMMRAVGAVSGSGTDRRANIDRLTCIQWLTALVGAQGHQKGPIGTTQIPDIKSSVQELLPESWRSEVTHSLVSQYRNVDPSSVITAAIAESTTAAPSASVERKASRKWHEKFRQKAQH